MVRSKAQVTGQHTTIFSASGTHECKSPKVHHAEAIASPALEMSTTLPRLPCRQLGPDHGAKCESQDTTAPRGAQAGVPLGWPEAQ